ncbi:unnamed protein product [Caenorhabditis angaria]|uniref:C-type lectin domain-containing protein n=1 Tax=Caenorhabditis angaria TaxID=860376 RepID=A0A9P1N7V1_9PELO|nr:unnamed protein product [Caenorhabditis angaria]
MYFFLLIFIFALGQGDLPCPQNWIHVAQLDVCYLSASHPAQWEFAEQYCNERESHMVSIDNQEQADVVKGIFGRENPDFLNWIGLRWNETAGNFTWSNGKPMTYSEFLPNSDNEECVSLALDENLYGWKSISCYYSQFFMCQKPAEGIRTIWHIGETSGTISMKNYSNLESITHIIKAPENSRVLLKFLDFDTEKSRDYVTISDLKTAFRISLLSGELEPGFEVLAKYNEVVINFKSDEDENDHRGFELNYDVISPLPTITFNNKIGIVSPPETENPYILQKYLITCEPEHHAIIKILDFELNMNDRLKFFDGETDDKRGKLATLRNGSDKTPLKSIGHVLLIAFESSQNAGNWKLSYECVYNGNLGDEIEI